MAKEDITILERKFRELPRSLTFEKDIKPVLKKAGISARTFQRDRKAIGNTIPHIRLQVYAGLFGCQVGDLIEESVKVKPLVNNSLGRKVGLKS